MQALVKLPDWTTPCGRSPSSPRCLLMYRRQTFLAVESLAVCGTSILCISRRCQESFGLRMLRCKFHIPCPPTLFSRVHHIPRSGRRSPGYQVAGLSLVCSIYCIHERGPNQQPTRFRVLVISSQTLGYPVPGRTIRSLVCPHGLPHGPKAKIHLSTPLSLSVELCDFALSIFGPRLEVLFVA